MTKEMKIHDISMILQEGMLTYPKDLPFERQLQRDLEKGDSSTVSVIRTSAHVGTHVDAPCHFVAEGYSVESIPLDHLYGPAYVVQCTGTTMVTEQELRGRVPEGTKRVLLKTDNSTALRDNPLGPFNDKFVYLQAGGAEYLAEMGVVLVGIDYLSIDGRGIAQKPAHHTLLERNITILEGILLADIAEGEYFLACGPLKIAGADGSPCRAVLIENESR